MKKCIEIWEMGLAVLLIVPFIGCSVAQHSAFSESNLKTSTRSFQDKAEATTILAIVNGHEITLADLQNQMKNLSQENRQAVVLYPEARMKFLDDLISIELILQEARQQLLGQCLDTESRLNRLNPEPINGELINDFLKKELSDKLAEMPEPTADELMKYYNNNMHTFLNTEGNLREFKEVESQLKQMLRAEKQRALYLDYAANLRSRATITVTDSVRALSSRDITLNDSKDMGIFDGLWEGQLIPASGPGLRAPDSVQPPRNRNLKIMIKKNEARVFIATEGRPIKEVKQNKFRVENFSTNALVYVIDTGKDNEGTWVETWAVALTVKDNNTLMAVFSRQVNNNDLPLDIQHSKFSQVSVGELKRIK